MVHRRRARAALASATLLLLAGLTGCAASDRACAAPVTGTIEFVSGSTPPPYHYEWTVRLAGATGTVTMTPGYADTESWSAEFDPDEAAFATVCGQLRAAKDQETAAGGATLTVDLDPASGRPVRLVTSDQAPVALVQAAVPPPVWAAVEQPYQQWQAAQRDG